MQSAAYSTLQYGAVRYSTVRYGTAQTVHYITLQYCTVRYGTVLYCTVLYCTVPYRTVQHSTARYGTGQHSTQYSTVRYSTVRCGTVQHSTVRYGTVRYGSVQRENDANNETIMLCTEKWKKIEIEIYTVAHYPDGFNRQPRVYPVSSTAILPSLWEQLLFPLLFPESEEGRVRSDWWVWTYYILNLVTYEYLCCITWCYISGEAAFEIDHSRSRGRGNWSGMSCQAFLPILCSGW